MTTKKRKGEKIGKKPRKIRIIIDFDCPRKCIYCCNKMPAIKNAMTPIDLATIKGQYYEIILTGGEPLLNIKRTKFIVMGLRKNNPKTKIYLYTAYFNNNGPIGILSDFYDIIDKIDGIHYTLHGNSKILMDVQNFYAFQSAIKASVKHRKTIDKPFSVRLHIGPEFKSSIYIETSIYSQIKTKIWKTPENVEVPAMEELFYIKQLRPPE